MLDAYIISTSRFLPNEPVENDEIEKYLGMVSGKPSRAKNIVLRHNGIKSRYYALNKDGDSTHTNFELAASAVNSLDCYGEKIDLLLAATSTPDQIIPSHASMVHGELKIENIEIASFSGSCCSGMQALKYGMISVAGGYRCLAAVVASEKPSSWMKARNYEDESAKLNELIKNPVIAFEKDFLRWMVSDGASALLLSPKPKGKISLKIEWLEIVSFADKFDACMYSGAEKNSDGSLIGWNEFVPEEWLSKSIFSIKQDVKLLNDVVVKTGIEHLSKVLKNHNVNIESIDYFLPHISSEFFRKSIDEEMRIYNAAIPQEKWFTNLKSVGNVGSASIFLMIDELTNSGKLKKGQNILILVPESARFTYAYTLLKVV